MRPLQVMVVPADIVLEAEAAEGVEEVVEDVGLCWWSWWRWCVICSGRTKLVSINPLGICID